MENLLIQTPPRNSSSVVSIGNCVDKNGPNQIQRREDAKRRIVVGFNVNGRDNVESIVNELKTKVDKQIKFPTGCYTTYGGAFENLNKAKDRLMIAVPISLLMIFILLFLCVSFSKTCGLLIYSAIRYQPLGIFFLALRGMPFKQVVLVLVLLRFWSCCSKRYCVLVSIQPIESRRMDDLHRIVLMGTKVRLRPVLMTAFVAS